MIAIDRLSKVYSNGNGVFDVDFAVRSGEVFGYLGPNGAGKTTTIRVLLGFTNPTEGTCSINGLNCRTQAEQVQRFTGYIPGEIAFMSGMTGIEFLNFIGDMRGTGDMRRRARLVERFELDARTSIRRMSKGTKQKLAIVTAFMHDPDVYVLDEPTSGLDPLMQETFVELVKEEQARGKTFLMSSHMFDEVARTCDRAAIIREGRIVAIEDVHSLVASQHRTFSVSVQSDEDVNRITASGLPVKSVHGHQVEIVVAGEYDLFIATLARCKVTGIDVATNVLEETFLKYYGAEVQS